MGRHWLNCASFLEFEVDLNVVTWNISKTLQIFKKGDLGSIKPFASIFIEEFLVT